MTTSDRLFASSPALTSVAERFPVPVAASLAMGILGNIDVAIERWPSDDQRPWLYAAGAALFLAAGAAHLFADRRRWLFGSRLALAIVLGMAVLLLVVFHASFETNPLFLFPALLISLMTAGYLDRRGSQEALWLFNVRVALAVVLASAAMAVGAGGISLLIVSFGYLFDVSIGEAPYLHVAATAICLLGPIYGLSLVPRDLDERLDIATAEPLLTKGIAAITNHALVPIVVAYSVILHVYGATVVFNWSLPKGQIGTMVLIYGLAGTAVWLISKPWQQTGTKLLRWFVLYWFWLTILPVALLGAAVWRRIAEYGVTPERYGLVLAAIWLVGLASYLGLKRASADSRVVLASLALGLLVGSFGPWGANGLSITSQVHRLEGLLAANGLLADDRLVEPLPASRQLPDAADRQASSIVRFLAEIDALDEIAYLFAGRSVDPFVTHSGSELLDAIHAEMGIAPDGRPDRVLFASEVPASYPVQLGSLLAGPFEIDRQGPSNDRAGETALSFLENGVVLTHADKRWEADGAALVGHARAGRQSASPLLIELHGRGNSAQLIIEHLTADSREGLDRITLLRAWAIIPAREEDGNRAPHAPPANDPASVR